VRRMTEELCEPLATEDYVVQSMPDVSPTKWHIAHVTWFFETLLLKPRVPGYRPFRPEFEVLFNSYYNSIGPQHPRAQRGLLTRPTVRELKQYRSHVDEAMTRLLGGCSEDGDGIVEILELGLNHEQQHQELLLMDIKHVFSRNPLFPSYRPAVQGSAGPVAAPSWHRFEGGLRRIGIDDPGFAFDNERPAHTVHLGRTALGQPALLDSPRGRME